MASKKKDESVLDIEKVDEKLAGGLVSKQDESPETPPQFQPAGATAKEKVPGENDEPLVKITEDGVLTVDLAALESAHNNVRSSSGAYVTKLFRRFEHDPGRVLHEIRRQGGVER